VPRAVHRRGARLVGMKVALEVSLVALFALVVLTALAVVLR
jgi:hypothetical protein